MQGAVLERVRPVRPLPVVGPARILDGARGRVWELPASRLPWLIAGFFAAVYGWLSIDRHDLLLSRAYDLGIFEQAVRGYAEGTGPISDIKGQGFNLLGDHFSPILALLAPLYRIWPHAETLLVAQAVLCGLTIVPLARWAQRALGVRAAVIVGVAVGASWGIAQAVTFDFHEIVFALPLLAFSLSALGQGRLRHAAFWALPLVFVKEDLGLTVAVIGVLICVRGVRGVRRLGLLTALWGVVWTALALFVIIPAFNPGHVYPYWGKVSGATNGHLATLVNTVGGMFTPDKAWTVFLLLVPAAFVALRSQLLWVAAPTMLWRFASDNPAYTGTGYHYNAIVVPIVFAAFIEGLVRWRRPTRRWNPRRALTASAVVTTLLVPAFGFNQLISLNKPERIHNAESARAVLARIPDGVTVAASNLAAPQLTDRDTVWLFGTTKRPAVCPDYIVTELGTGEWAGDEFPVSTVAQTWLYDQARAAGYVQVATDGWLIVLRFTGAPAAYFKTLVADGPPDLLVHPAADGGTERGSDFVWKCRAPDDAVPQPAPET